MPKKLSFFFIVNLSRILYPPPPPNLLLASQPNFPLLEQIEIEDINVSQRLEKELKREYHLITAQKRLDQIAADFVRHYSTQWENGKAMLICIDKITCVRMYDLIDRYWQQRLIELEKAA